MNDKQREYTVKEIERHQKSIDEIERKWAGSILMVFSIMLAFSGEKVFGSEYFIPMLGTVGIIATSIDEINNRCRKSNHRQQIANLEYQLVMDELATPTEVEKAPQKTMGKK